jgi:hypothetical protein
LGVTDASGLLVRELSQVQWQLVCARHGRIVDKHWNDGHIRPTQDESNLLMVHVIGKLDARAVLFIGDGQPPPNIPGLRVPF